jgi:hypothetical protein
MKKKFLLMSMLTIGIASHAQNWQSVDGTSNGSSGLFTEYTTGNPLPYSNNQGNPYLTFGYCLEKEENSNAMFVGGFFNHVLHSGNNTTSTNVARLNGTGWQSNFGFQFPLGNQSNTFPDYPQAIALTDMEEFFVPGTSTRTTWAAGVPLAFLFPINGVPGLLDYLPLSVTYFDPVQNRWVEPGGIITGYTTCMQEFNGDLYLGGQFLLNNPLGLQVFIKLSPNGTITPIPFIGSEINTLEVIEINGVEKLFVGGRFSGVSTAIPATNIASLEIILGAEVWSSVGVSTNVGINQGIPAAVYSIDKYQKAGIGDVLCAGTEPINASGITVNNGCIPQLAALICIPGSATSNINDVYAGGLWELNGGVGNWNNTIKTNGPVYAVEGANNNVHVGGLFSSIVDLNSLANPIPANNFFSWSGLNLYNQNNGFNHVVFDLEGWNNELFATGLFDQTVSSNRSVVVNKIAKLNLGAGTNFHTQKSAIIQAKENSFEVMVYPNPVSDELTISILLGDYTDPNISLTLLDISGKHLINQNIIVDETKEGKITLQLNALSLKTGLYILKVSSSENQYLEKIHYQY